MLHEPRLVIFMFLNLTLESHIFAAILLCILYIYKYVFTYALFVVHFVNMFYIKSFVRLDNPLKI